MSPGDRRRAAALVGLTAAVAIATPPPAGADAPRTSHAAGAASQVAAPSRREAWRARVVYPAVVRAAPRTDARRTGTVATTGRWNGGPVRLLVLAVRRDDQGRRWLRVALPERPNGRSGWIEADFTHLSLVRWRVEISRRARRVRVYYAGRLRRSWPAVIGKPSTPTPRGLFAVYERVRQPAGSELGPWALHLTAHSDTLFDYGGGPGRVALHGRSGPLLADPLGSAASHGCIRVDNAAIRWLAARAGPGTPVLIR